MSTDELEQLLTSLINRLVTAVAGAQVDEWAVTQVAAELVAHDLTGSTSIGRSIEVLGDGLPLLAELKHVEGRAIVRMLGALAGGYVEALRQRTLGEQDQITQAVLEAKLDTERELQISEARFRQIFAEAVVGIAISELDGMVITANRAFAGILGRTPDDLIGAALPDLLQLHAGGDLRPSGLYRELADGSLTHFRHRGRLTAASGDVAWVFVSGSVLRDPDGVPTHHVITTEDITELELLRLELSEQALHDRLTGLPNEHYFMSHLKDALEGADPSALVTVCRVNLDSFSVINDGIGRSAGEFLLRSVARRLRELVIGERAMVARMGADDFAILIQDGTDGRDLSLFAKTINIRLCEPVYLDGNRGIAVSAGVGVVHRRAGGISAGELIRAADATLHRAKRTGRGQWDLYDGAHDAQQRQRYQLAAEIPGAWENGDIELWHQPVYGLDSGLIVAIQAVLRWNRADGTVLGHSECLALAERTGLVVLLGRWMMQEACVNLAAWTACSAAPRVPLLRVDLTAQLSQDPDLIGVVRGALSATHARAELLQVGVPLAALARGRGDVVNNVGVLTDLGAGVVLLGAATGPGFLAYLEDFTVGAVEIAPETVARIAQRPGDDSVVARAIRETIPLVHSAGATVIVPGVDTPEQAQWWRSGGADSARGAHFCSPIPGVELQPLLLAEPP